MSNYTEQEVQDAVEKIVRSTVRHPTGILGDRKIDVSFSDIQEAAAGVYILYFNAPFYTVLLGARKLADLVQTQASTVESLVDAVRATDRLVTPISDISPLANARTALAELEAAVTARSVGFQDINQVPAFRRYAKNIDSFLQTIGPNVKGTGTPSATPSVPSTPSAGSVIVDTPSGARSKIPSLVRQVVEQHAELVRRSKLLAGAIEDFASVNLPRIAAQGVISRAREVLDGHYSALEALDENTRLTSLREVVLDLLTQRPLVAKYGAAQAPSEFVTTSGLARGFADAEHPAQPAKAFSDFYGPYPIRAMDQFIRFEMNGEAPFDYPLPLSFIAQLDGTLQEPFLISATNNQLLLGFGQVDTGLPLFPITLTNGLRSAAQVATEVNAQLGFAPLTCEEVFYPLKYKAPMVITSLGGNNAQFLVLGGGLTGLGIAVGDELDILSGVNAATTWTITFVDPSGLYVNGTSGAPVVSVPLPGADVEIGPAARALRLRDQDEASSLALRRTLRVVRTGGEEDLTAATLGFYPGSEARSRPVDAKAVVDNINSSTSKLRATLDFQPREYAGVARSEPTNPTVVVFTKGTGRGVISGGTNVTLFMTFEEHQLGSTFEDGDVLVIRASTTAADVGKEGIITGDSGPNLLLTFSTPITAGDITFEVGPDVVFGFGDVVIISDGPNAGRYVIGEDQEVGTTASFEAVLAGVLPSFKDGDLPKYFNAQLGAERVVFESRDTTLASRIGINNAVTGLGAGFFFSSSSLPVDAAGFTNWLQFEKFPAGASVGDVVQLYTTQYNVVSDMHTITGLNAELRLVELDTAVVNTFAMTFDIGVPNPFGRIRIAQVANYSDLKERLDTWLVRPAQQESYFRELARLLNPIVTNANPTASMVNDATNHLMELLATLTEVTAASIGEGLTPPVTTADTLEFALASYEAPTQEPVDTLLATFRQKGADRAIDLLIEGQFSTFFNLTVDGVSYSGALMSGLRELAREDLPVRKFNRKGSGSEKLIGATQDETDFEFSYDDADSPTQPDIPASPDVATPGENY